MCQVPQQRTEFSVLDPKYMCLCEHVHVKTGTVIICLICTVAVFLQAVSTLSHIAPGVSDHTQELARLIGLVINLCLLVMLIQGLRKERPTLLLPIFIALCICIVSVGFLALIVLVTPFIDGGQFCRDIHPVVECDMLSMNENEISDPELEPNPCEMETPEDEQVEETFRKRSFDYEKEKLRADVRFNCVLGVLDSDRTNNTEWCSCAKCKGKDQPRECVCCLEYKAADDIYADKVRLSWEDGSSCMSEMLFVGVATNQESLDFAILNMSNKKREKLARSRDKNKTRRYLAYKRCVYHIFGTMKHGERIILPSCVVSKILEKFPPTNDEKRKGFRRGHEVV